MYLQEGLLRTSGQSVLEVNEEALSVLFDISDIHPRRGCAFLFIKFNKKKIKRKYVHCSIKFDLVQIFMTFLTCASPTKRVKCTI